MIKHTLHLLTGLCGIPSDENLRAQRWARRFELPMILLAIWILVEWYLLGKDIYSELFGQITDWIVWLFFVLETVLLASLVDNKFRYLRNNWMNLLIIVTGVPLLWGGGSYAAALRSLRVLLIIPMLLNISKTVRKILSHNNLGSVLIVALAFTLMSGLIIAGIDPNIDNVWDGIWWAWVTVATVGYGDLVPVTPAGKVFGAVVILFGVGFFSLLTASFSAFFISRGEIEIEQEEIEEINQLNAIEARIDAMEKTLRRIESRLPEPYTDKGRADDEA